MAKSKTEKGAGGAATKERHVAQAGSKTPTADGAEPAAPPRPRVSPLKFLQEVRKEVSMVTWPVRKETTVTTIMVFVMVVLAALFFLLVDWALGTAVRYALQLIG